MSESSNPPDNQGRETRVQEGMTPRRDHFGMSPAKSIRGMSPVVQSQKGMSPSNAQARPAVGGPPPQPADSATSARPK